MNKLSEQLKDVVQPLIAIIFSVTACVALFVGKLSTDQWYSLAIAVISFYFGAKIASNVVKRAPNRSTDVLGNQLPSTAWTKSARRRK